MNGIEGVLGQATTQGIVNAEQAAQLLRLFRDAALASPTVGPRSICPLHTSFVPPPPQCHQRRIPFFLFIYLNCMCVLFENSFSMANVLHYGGGLMAIGSTSLLLHYGWKLFKGTASAGNSYRGGGDAWDVGADETLPHIVEQAWVCWLCLAPTGRLV